MPDFTDPQKDNVNNILININIYNKYKYNIL